MNRASSVQLEGLSKLYQASEPAVDRVSFTARSGELIVLLGESGCGKTTTLKMINRLVEPSSGEIRVNGKSVTRIDPVELRRSIGYVFQGIGLFPHLTVAENVGVTPGLLGWDRRRITGRVDELLTLVHLPPERYRDRMPGELSGGEGQRVGFARALAAGPSILLLDEPFGALDPLTRDSLQTEFREIQSRLGLTAIFVTHDMTEALLLADRILIMRRGRILQDGTPHEILTRPADDYVARLMDAPKRQAAALENLLEPGFVSGQGELGE